MFFGLGVFGDFVDLLGVLIILCMFLFVLDSDLGFRIFVIVEFGLDNIFCLKKLRIFMFIGVVMN